MPTESSRIKLTGFRNADQIDDIFASSMVDVAYIDKITPDAIYVISDDPPEQADHEWIAEIITLTLAEYGINDVKIELPE